MWKSILRVWAARFVCPEATATEVSMFQIVKADRDLSVELILAHWHVPSSREVFTFSFISFILGGLVLSLADWAVGTRCRLAISTDVHKLSVKKWLFNNIAFKAYAQGPVGHYRAITSEIFVWTSGGKLMCCCDERFSLREAAARAGQDRLDQLQIKLVAVSVPSVLLQHMGLIIKKSNVVCVCACSPVPSNLNSLILQ